MTTKALATRARTHTNWILMVLVIALGVVSLAATNRTPESAASTPPAESGMASTSAPTTAPLPTVEAPATTLLPPPSTAPPAPPTTVPAPTTTTPEPDPTTTTSPQQTVPPSTTPPDPAPPTIPPTTAPSPTVPPTAVPPTTVPATTVPPTTVPPTTVPPNPGAEHVTVVGDSMFAIGHTDIKAALADRDDLHLAEYVAQPGTTVHTNSELARIIEENPEVLVLSFQINDLLGYGAEEALANFDALMQRSAHLPCIRWVTFYDDPTFGVMVEGLEALAERYDNLETIPFHAAVADNPTWRYPPDFPYGGDIHLNPNEPGTAHLGEMIADSIDC